MTPLHCPWDRRRFRAEFGASCLAEVCFKSDAGRSLPRQSFHNMSISHLGVCKPCLSHCLDEASAHHAPAQASPPYSLTLHPHHAVVVATNIAGMPSLIAFWLCPADGGRRTILFSSFDPDMCAELASRQAAPVMLLSDGGLQLYADPRRNSIQAAIAFASGSGLKGIILETAALRQDQHCVEAAQNQGLKVSREPVPDWHS